MDFKAELANIGKYSRDQKTCAGKMFNLFNRAKKASALPELYRALEESDLIDWRAYLKANPDLSRTTPLYHYIFHGVWEKRPLYFFQSPDNREGEPEKPENTGPAVSVIMPVYNSHPYLYKSVFSILNQTLADIELIMVNDCSADNSLDAMQKFASQDDRVRLVNLEKNVGTHMARKAGVEAARGKFIMFLDPDDYYVPEACEIACRAMEDGADIAHFNVKVKGRNVTGNMSEHIMNVMNRHPEGEYTARQILDRQLLENRFMHNVCNKIFKSSLVKRAFEEMADGYFIAGEDMYEFLFIVPEISRYKKIEDFLYVYNYGQGVSAEDISSRPWERLPFHTSLYASLKKFYSRPDLEKYLPSIADILSVWALNVIPNINPGYKNRLFNKIVADLGEELVMNELVKKYHKDNRQLQVLMRDLGYQTAIEVATVAMILPASIAHAGLKVFASLQTALAANGIKLIGIINDNLEVTDLALENPDILAMPIADQDINSIKSRLKLLLAACKRNSVNAMLVPYEDWNCFSWDFLAAKAGGIPVISFIPGLLASADFSGARLRQLISSLSAFDKVLVQTPQDMCMLKCADIDAALAPQFWGQVTGVDMPEEGAASLMENEAADFADFLRNCRRYSAYTSFEAPFLSRLIYNLTPGIQQH